jgi:hypothetical protein
VLFIVGLVIGGALDAAEPPAPVIRGMVVVKAPSGEEIPLYNNSYALVIGNGAYRGGWRELPRAVKDAEEVAQALKATGFNVTLATNVTRANFDKVFQAFSASHGEVPENRILIYYAGHGATETLVTGEKWGSIAMVDSPLPAASPGGYYLTSVPLQRLYDESKRMKARHVLYMFDSCFSGTLLQSRASDQVPAGISKLVQNPVRQFITSGSEDENVPDESAFKQIFVDLLTGRMNDYVRDGYLTGQELAYLLSRYVPERSPIPQTPQEARINNPGLNKGDFVFVLKPAAGQPTP